MVSDFNLPYFILLPKSHIVYNCGIKMCYVEHRQATMTTITTKFRDIVKPIYHYLVKICTVLLNNQHTASPEKYFKHCIFSVWLRVNNNRLEIFERNQAFHESDLRIHRVPFPCCICEDMCRVQVGSYTVLVLNIEVTQKEKRFQQLDTVFQHID